MMPETVSALRELNEHPDTVFTVLTGTGRFFSAGADVKGIIVKRYMCSKDTAKLHLLHSHGIYG